MAKRFAAYIPVGPSLQELDRLMDLVDSLVHFEPSVSHVVIVDDATETRITADLIEPSVRSRAAILRLPFSSSEDHLVNGRLCAMNCYVLEWIASNLKVDYVVKFDTDTVVIAPFSHALSEALRVGIDIGLIGTIGPTCNRHSPLYGWRSDLFESALRKVPLYIDEKLIVDGRVYLDEGVTATIEQVNDFNVLRPDFELALERGYQMGEYCEGGAYVISSKMLNRLIECGYAEKAIRWLRLPFGEDVVMGMYASVVGLRLMDMSQPGEPFGIQSLGLAYSPQVLIEEKYSVVHSVKNDSQYSEMAIRAFFREMRARKG